MEVKYKGQFAVITGASSGIGYELAKIFARNGFDLLVVAEDLGIVEAGDAFRKFGTRVDAIKADLTRVEEVQMLYEKIKSMNHPVDALVLNAGVGVSGEFVETHLSQELSMIQLNIVSLVHLTKLVLPDMVERNQGRILFTSSIAATMPGPYYAVYAATKAFVQSFAEAIRYEVKDRGVVITALQPGVTDTLFFERAHMLDTKAGVSKKDDPAEVAQQGFDALMRGDDHVVAGSFMNKVQATLAKFMTEPMAASVQGSSVKPGSAHKN